MIIIKRKVSNKIEHKKLLDITNAVYTIDLKTVNKVILHMQQQLNSTSSIAAKQLINQEITWLEKWINELDLKENESNVKKASNITIEQKNNFSYIDSEDIGLDLFNQSFLKNTTFTSSDLLQVAKLTTSGIVNNFRFYNRPNCRTVVFDYRKLFDCIALYYGYRELDISIEQIESVLENCSAASLNTAIELESIMKFCLGAYTSLENVAENLIEKQADVKTRDGDLYNLISNLRISTNCFQIIKSSNQIETWQHQRLNLKPKITYEPVLRASQTEIMIDLINGIITEIKNNSTFNDIKLLCADNGCIALSVPNNIENSDLQVAFGAILVMFNRNFIIKNSIYTYNSNTDSFIKEA